MQISIIITTYKRRKDLQECLKSVLLQNHLPREILIVDNGNDKETEKLVKENLGEFERKNIFLKYLRNERKNSLTVARNIGIKNVKGEIILFLDDDVVLDKNYIENILKVYEKYPNAKGVQGYIKKEQIRKIKNFLNRLFFFYHFEKDKCRVLPSFSATYPKPVTKIIPCQWLSGANHSYKREILEDSKYDEKLKKYSEGEDLEFSYRVFKKYPGSLYITPYAKLIHKASPAGRILGKELISMMEVYGLYLFYKLFDHNLKNKMIYIWNRIGKLIFNIGRSIFKLSPKWLKENIYLLEAYFLCIKHIKEIKNGNLEFFNKTLK